MIYQCPYCYVPFNDPDACKEHLKTCSKRDVPYVEEQEENVEEEKPKRKRSQE